MPPGRNRTRHTRARLLRHIRMSPGRNWTRHTASLNARLLRHIRMSAPCSHYTGLLIHICVSLRRNWTQHTAALNTGLLIYIQGASKQRSLEGMYLFLSQRRFINAHAHMHMCRLGWAWVWRLETHTDSCTTWISKYKPASETFELMKSLQWFAYNHV